MCSYYFLTTLKGFKLAKILINASGVLFSLVFAPFFYLYMRVFFIRKHDAKPGDKRALIYTIVGTVFLYFQIHFDVPVRYGILFD